MTPDQQAQLLALFAAHQYELLTYAVMAIVIGGLVRLCKSDSPIPLLARIPSVWRPRIALALGLVGGVFQALAEKTPLPVAIAGGLLASFTAISGHEVVVEGMLRGREPFAPKPPPATPRQGVSPGAFDAPPPRPPMASRRAGFAMMLSGVVVAAFVLAPACIPAAVGPGVSLGECVEKLAQTQPPLTFIQYIGRGLSQCGWSLVQLLAAIIDSKDPAVAQYQNDARDALAHPEKLESLKASVRAYQHENHIETKDGGL